MANQEGGLPGWKVFCVDVHSPSSWENSLEGRGRAHWREEWEHFHLLAKREAQEGHRDRRIRSEDKGRENGGPSRLRGDTDTILILISKSLSLEFSATHQLQSVYEPNDLNCFVWWVIKSPGKRSHVTLAQISAQNALVPRLYPKETEQLCIFQFKLLATQQQQAVLKRSNEFQTHNKAGNSTLAPWTSGSRTYTLYTDTQ